MPSASSCAIAALIAGCGGSDGGTGPASSGAAATAPSRAVTIEDYLYEPATITVPKGTTVTFANRDSTPHTATSKQSGALRKRQHRHRQVGKITLEDSGTFAYYCLFHPFMKGTIVVD